METIRQQLRRIREGGRYYAVRRRGDQIIGVITGTPRRYDAQRNVGGLVYIEDANHPTIWELRVCHDNPANNQRVTFGSLAMAKSYARTLSEYDWIIYCNGTIHTTHNRRTTAEG